MKPNKYYIYIENSVDTDRLAKKPADQDLIFFPHNMRNSEYDQEIPQSQTAGKPMVLGVHSNKSNWIPCIFNMHKILFSLFNSLSPSDAC